MNEQNLRLVTQFHAIIPDLASALNVSGTGYSRIKLDVAENELEKVMELRGCADRRVANVPMVDEKPI